MRKLFVAKKFSTYPEEWHFAPVLDTGNFAFLSGITGVHPDQSISADPETQMRDTFRFVGMHFTAAELNFDHVVEMTSYHVGLREHLKTFIQVKDEFINAPYPAWTAVGIAELITAGSLHEIRIIAKRN